MLDRLKEFFRCQSCKLLAETSSTAIQAKNETIILLKDEIEYLRSEKSEIQALLNRALRLSPLPPPGVAGSLANVTQDPTPVDAMVGSRWGSVKRRLEKKYKKESTPEDVKADYWSRKAKEMEDACGINQAEEVHAGNSARDDSPQGIGA